MPKKNFYMIDRNLVEHVARLARIELSDEEKEKFEKELNEILENFRKIDKVYTSKIEPSLHPLPIENVWRSDKAIKFEWNPLENAKNKEKKYFRGPRIV